MAANPFSYSPGMRAGTDGSVAMDPAALEGEASGEDANILLYLLQTVVAPARLAGSILLVPSRGSIRPPMK